MKKSLVALAALAVVGAASAQSTVTLYGAVDAGYVSGTTDGVTNTTLGNSQLGSSKLGFMGTEDLGGGLKANFKLEGGLANNTGNGKASNANNQTNGGATTAALGATGNASTVSTGGSQGLDFQRFSYVGLSGNFGELRLGRDYNNAFLQSAGATDPFGTNGPAALTQVMYVFGNVTSVNVSNAIGYTSPSLSGFKAAAQVYYGANNSNASNSGAGDGYSLLLNYAAGPIYAAVAQATTRGTAAAASATAYAALGDYTQKSVALSYDLGVAKLNYAYIREEQADANTTTKKGVTGTNTTNQIGAVVPFGAANAKVSFARAAFDDGIGGTDNGTLFGLGADYSLSKRTVAYFTYARVSNDASTGQANLYYAGGAPTSATASVASTSYTLGIKHAF
jgi:predicted porin